MEEKTVLGTLVLGTEEAAGAAPAEEEVGLVGSVDDLKSKRLAKGREVSIVEDTGIALKSDLESPSRSVPRWVVVVERDDSS